MKKSKRIKKNSWKIKQKKDQFFKNQKLLDTDPEPLLN